MLGHAMEQTASIITTSRNKYGDEVLESSSEIKCRFRWITKSDSANNMENIKADAMLWVPTEIIISNGQIVFFNEEYFKVREIIEARRLRGDTVYFKKCYLDKYARLTENAS